MGDLYKVTLDWDGDEVSDVIVQVFDTVPVANLRTLCITKARAVFFPFLFWTLFV